MSPLDEDAGQRQLREHLIAHPHPDAELVLMLAAFAEVVTPYFDEIDGRLRVVQLYYNAERDPHACLHWAPEWGFCGDDKLALGIIWQYTRELEQSLGAEPLQEAAHALQQLLSAMQMQEGREQRTLHISQPNAKCVWDEAKAEAEQWLVRRGFCDTDPAPQPVAPSREETTNE